MAALDPSAAESAPQAAEPAGDELRELIAEGREQGYLTTDLIADALRDAELTPEQFENILMLLTDQGIEILEGEEATAADAAGEEEAVLLGRSPSPRRPPTRSACT